MHSSVTSHFLIWNFDRCLVIGIACLAVGIAALVFLLGRIFLRPPTSQAQPEPVFDEEPGALKLAVAGVLPFTDKTEKRLRQELIQAGYYRNSAIVNFAAFRNASLMIWVVFIAATLVLTVDRGRAFSLQVMGIGLIISIFIYSVPGVLLTARAAGRRKRIYHSLPDALDMLTMMMTGGLGLNTSLQRVSRELRSAHPDLAQELAIVSRQADVGSFGQAMQNFADRVDEPEITGLSALIHHTERLGSPIGTALIEYSDGIRRARRQRAEEMGNKRSVMLLFPVIAFLAPPIYILLLGPALLELRNFIDRENKDGGVLAQTVQNDTPGTDRQLAPPLR